MGVGEGEEVQIKGTDSILNKIIAENFLCLEKKRLFRHGRLLGNQIKNTNTDHPEDM
jgi:hypothetical protein